jgi:hypothetical protein
LYCVRVYKPHRLRRHVCFCLELMLLCSKCLPTRLKTMFNRARFGSSALPSPATLNTLRNCLKFRVFGAPTFAQQVTQENL